MRTINKPFGSVAALLLALWAFTLSRDVSTQGPAGGQVVKIRGGTATQIAAITPASREILFDTTNLRLVLGDGSTLGGAAVIPNATTLGSSYQPLDSDLTAIAALTTTSFARGLLDDANAAAVRTTIGAVIGTDVQAYDADLAALGGVTSAANRVPYFTGSGTASLATFTAFARTMLAGSDAGTVRGIIGAQEDSANLLDLSVVSPSNDAYIYGSGSSWTTGTITTFGRSLVDDAAASNARTTLGVGAAALRGSSASLGGGALSAGACATNTTTVTGATTAMVVSVTPVTYPGDAAVWSGYVSSADTITTRVCAVVNVTPTASVYRIAVIP